MEVMRYYLFYNYFIMKIKNWDAYLWDCLEIMDNLIEQWVKVDAIITDPPYWTTACKRDTVIPFDKMWERLNKLIKPNGAIVLFWSEPFSSALRMSNIKQYKYDWIWDKKKHANAMLAKYQPLKVHENIHIFSNKTHNYYPIKEKRKARVDKEAEIKNWDNFWGGVVKRWYSNTEWLYNPKSILEISNANQKWKVHPTQKPVALIEYLIKTYTNEWELVLDFTAGSFTTAVACENTNRKRICIEKDEWYYNIWIDRVNGDTN